MAKSYVLLLFFNMKHIIISIFTILFFTQCSRNTPDSPINESIFLVKSLEIDGKNGISATKGISVDPTIILSFDIPVNSSSANKSIELYQNNTKITIQNNLSADKKKITISPRTELNPLTTYTLVVRNILQADNGNKLQNEYSSLFTTGIDNKDKFARIPTEELLTKIQKQTFNFFWDFAHPTNGMIRERNSSGDIVTTGGTGFGIMTILVGIERGFITKSQGLERIRNIVAFLKKADTYHGAFSHWYNGNTAKTIAFSSKDDGADLVETSLLFQGLLTARNYFNDVELNTEITALYQNVEWSFFQNNSQTLYWHWSNQHNWEMNLALTGWNEALITYVLAAGSPTYTIEKSVYDNGWGKSGAIKNGNSYFNIVLPLGPAQGGPLFLSQYSFLGLNPNGLEDIYAKYDQQTKNHTLINRAYCISNPKMYYGYSASSWGLTASDNMDGYSAHSPDNDNSVIAPTAAITSIAFTPQESLAAIEFFYYKLGDRLWGTYGFKDAFSLDKAWFADSYIAINQGPIIIGIENYRTGLLWKYFMQSPEVKNGLKKLQFTSPNL